MRAKSAIHKPNYAATIGLIAAAVSAAIGLPMMQRNFFEKPRTAPASEAKVVEKNGSRLRRTISANPEQVVALEQLGGGPFEISRSVIAGGGGTSSGGSFEESGTIGEAVAGTTSDGGSFSVTSGFWQAETSIGSPSPTATPTATVTVTATPTATPTQTPAPIISGRVTYENAAVPVVPVPHTVISAVGSPPVSVETDLSGNYSLSGFGPGDLIVRPSKVDESFLTPNGVFSNDAALISQHVVHLITLNPTQQRAGRVSGGADLTSLDAAFIAQWIVGLTNPNNQTGRWAFTPATRTYSNVNTDLANENYDALLMGDVNGDWIAPNMRPEEPVPGADTASVSLGMASAPAGKIVNVPLTVGNLAGRRITSYQFDMLFDPQIVEVAGVDSAGTVSEGMSTVWNLAAPGVLKVVVYGAIGADDDGIYLNLRLRGRGTAGSTSTLELSGFRYNNGTAAQASAGSFTIVKSPAISGLVMTSTGLGLRNATVVLTGNSLAEPRKVLTGEFGYFAFDDLTPGETYIVTVNSKRFIFQMPSRVIALTGKAEEVNFVALE